MALDVGTGGTPRSEGGLRLAMAAIFKNEGPYILEWVAHHRALGIERFFIADNDSSDETTATLAALACAGIVEHLPFPSEPGLPPQPAAYDAILRRYRDEADWIAFLDADEFLVPAAAYRSLRRGDRGDRPRPGCRGHRGQLGALRLRRPAHRRARPVAERFAGAPSRCTRSTATTSRSSVPPSSRARCRTRTICR